MSKLLSLAKGARSLVRPTTRVPGSPISICRPPAFTRSKQGAAMASTDATSSLHPKAKEVLDWWLGSGWATAGPTYFPEEKMKVWFRGGPEVDKEVIEKFGEDCEAFSEGRYDSWQQQPYNCLAGILIGDQLTRNVYRDTAKMYVSDDRVLAWAKALVTSGADKNYKPIERVWIYMPYMHNEDVADQEECMRLFEGLGEECRQLEGGEPLVTMTKLNVDYAGRHRDVIAKWGRFPHRNALLGRASTPEEEAGLLDGSIQRF